MRQKKNYERKMERHNLHLILFKNVYMNIYYCRKFKIYTHVKLIEIESPSNRRVLDQT